MPTPTMKAVRLHEHGGPEVLACDEVPTPVPGRGEVLVRVHTVGINPPDWCLRDGLSTGRHKPSRIDHVHAAGAPMSNGSCAGADSAGGIAPSTKTAS